MQDNIRQNIYHTTQILNNTEILISNISNGNVSLNLNYIKNNTHLLFFVFEVFYTFKGTKKTEETVIKYGLKTVIVNQK